MGAQVAVGLALGALCVAVALIAAVACCRCLWVIWPHSTAWLLSSREEKVGLTRAGAGHYSANGYLITSDSDIRLDVAAGSFQRFDPVDRDFRVVLAETSACGVTSPWSPPPTGSPPPSSIAPASIPPQPLRPAPAPKRSQLPSASSTSSASSATSPPPTSPPLVPPPRPPAPNLSITSTVTTFSTWDTPPTPPPPPPPPIPPPPRLFQSQSLPEKVVAPEVPPAPEAVVPLPEESPSELQQEQAPELPPELPPPLLRASSFDSVCSDTSVDLSDLEVGNPGEPQVTGYLCVGIEYDRGMSYGSGTGGGATGSTPGGSGPGGAEVGGDLIVSVLEAKDLRGTDGVSPASDTYVRVLLLPDKSSQMQTRVYRRSSCPTYKEKFLFVVDSAAIESRSLQFYVYASDRYSNTLIGEAELRLSDVTARRQPVTTWLTLTDMGSQRGTEFGEIMFSLSYLPTAERLTVVVVKARNLRFSTPHIGDPFVKVYLLQRGKKVHKKRTTARKGERSPIFNEAMIFSVPAHALQTIQLRVTVADSSDIAVEGGVGRGAARSVGHVIVGSQATGKALSHWSQMLSSLRKPIAMWHPLRK